MFSLKKYKEKNIAKQISAFEDIEGWLTIKEATALYQTARQLQRNAVVVEIGSWQGKSTYCIAKGLKHGKLFAIDPFNADAGFDTNSEQEYKEKKGTKNLFDVFINNMKRLKVFEKIVIKKGYSADFVNDFEKINFLFIDGDHSVEGCKKDFDLYSNKIISGGFIAFHDYYKDRPNLGPTYVADNLVLQSGKFKFCSLHDSLWIAKKIK